ncbi:C-type lectin Cal-like [Mobula hypostoma]|uniref:C-type lectin Cal-like n=1 Tax=Mobula hypostoma TaxID=723540 RepID=UPI002FC29F3B
MERKNVNEKEKIEGRNMMLVTTLLVSDVAGKNSSLEVEETLRSGEITRGPCEIGWFVYQPTRSCYHCFTTLKTWKDAEFSCNREKHYGHLASVTSYEHNNIISKVVHKVNKNNQYVWIGLKDSSKNGNFRWIDQSPSCYMNWDEGRPVHYDRNRHCVFANYNSKW